MNIEIRRIKEEEIKRLGITNWPVWEKEESNFPWHYNDKESCYFLEGEVEVETGGKKIFIKKGDFVIFPKGLDCEWHIIKKVKKHYNFD